MMLQKFLRLKFTIGSVQDKQQSSSVQ